MRSTKTRHHKVHLVVAVVDLLHLNKDLVLEFSHPTARCFDVFHLHIVLLQHSFAELCITSNLIS